MTTFLKQTKKYLTEALRKREHINSMIKSYTNDWVQNEKYIIELQNAIEKLEA